MEVPAGLKERLVIMKHWLAGRRNGVSIGALMHRVTQAPSVRFARRRTRIADASAKSGDDLAYISVGEQSVGPLYWPKVVDRRVLYQTVAESCNPTDWHYYEVPETRVAAGDVVVDCGAAEGLFSLLVSSRAGHVYAIEPSALYLGALRSTLPESMGNVTVLPVAIGAEQGTATFNQDGRIQGAASEQVRIETIDALFANIDRPLHYLKADLEGHEMEMLTGARETIRRYKPKIAITTYHREAHAQQIADFLRTIHPQYNIRVKGIEPSWGVPVMLHAWP